MYQTREGKQWFLGLKVHIGVDAKTGLTHSLSTTAARDFEQNQKLEKALKKK